MSNKNVIFCDNVLILFLSTVWKITIDFCLFCLFTQKKEENNGGGAKKEKKKKRTGKKKWDRVEQSITSGYKPVGSFKGSFRDVVHVGVRL